jgi:hypothetical protein
MKKLNDRDQQLEYLKNANKILSDSINVDSDENWFAYSTRMLVRLDIADLIIERDQNKAKSSLENAKKDGYICFKSQKKYQTRYDGAGRNMPETC